MQEIALFMMGEFRENLPVGQGFVDNVIQDIDAKHPLIAMRILWLLEKLCNHDEFFRESKEQKLQQIFEKLVEIFISGQGSFCSFPLKYQCLRTMYKYTKRINLKT